MPEGWLTHCKESVTDVWLFKFVQKIYKKENLCLFSTSLKRHPSPEEKMAQGKCLNTKMEEYHSCQYLLSCKIIKSISVNVFKYALAFFTKMYRQSQV